MLGKTATGNWVFNDLEVNDELKYWNNYLYAENKDKLEKHHNDNYLFYSGLSDTQLFNYLYQNLNRLNKTSYSTEFTNRNDRAISTIDLHKHTFRLQYFTHKSNTNRISEQVLKELAETDIHLHLILSILLTRFQLVVEYPEITVQGHNNITCVYEHLEFVERADRLQNA